MTKKSLAVALLLGTVLTANHSSLFAMDEDHAAAAPAAHQSLMENLSKAGPAMFPAQAKELFELATMAEGVGPVGPKPLKSAVQDVVKARF